LLLAAERTRRGGGDLPSALTAGEGCQWQGWDGARSLAGTAPALHYETSAGTGQLH